MIYGRLFNFIVLLLLPIHLLCILELSNEVDSLNIGFEEAAVNVVASAAASAAADVVSHAFVQTGSELLYFRDVSHQEILLSSISFSDRCSDSPNRKLESKKTPKNVAIFEQEVTHFNSTDVGVPVSQRIYVVNPTNTKIVFSAITSSANFHCSFFSNKVLEPKERTKFTVIFSPTQEGLIEDYISVHSSIGKFSHKVSVNVTANPYRIGSYAGIRVPFNGTFVAPITLHNPHLSTLKIVEVFSSDSNIQLELVDNAFAQSGKGWLWELAPFETKQIIRTNILGNVERNITSFIYIKAQLKSDYLSGIFDGFSQPLPNLSTNEGKDNPPLLEKNLITLVISLEVQITRRRGIFSLDHSFDFGMVREGDHSKQLTFRVLSNIEKGVEIESIYVGSSNDRVNGIYMQYASKPPLSIKCGARSQPGLPVAIANINLLSGHVSSRDDQSSTTSDDEKKIFHKYGTIVAESRGGNYNITVPYRALVYWGDLVYDPGDLAFHHQLSPVVSREVVFTNNFSFPLAIWKVKISDEQAREAFHVELTTPVVILSSQQSLPALLVKYLRRRASNFSTTCTVHTNLTTFDVPILLFDGKLQISLSSLEQQKLDFGYVNAGERRSILMEVVNSNPVSITIKQLRPPMSRLIALTLESHQIVFKLSNSKEAFLKADELLSAIRSWIPGDDLTIPSNAVLTLNFTFTSLVLAESYRHSAGNPHDDIFILRTNFDEYKFPVTFQFTNSMIFGVPPSISFYDCFIGTVHSKMLKVYSTYQEDLAVKRVFLLKKDPRFFLSKFTSGADVSTAHGLIKAGSVSALGKVHFIPEASCVKSVNSDDCYLGIPLDTPDGQWFTYGLKLPQNLAEIDSYLYGRLRRKWAALPSRTVNTTVVVETTKVKNFEIPIQSTLKWPRLLSHSVVRFPLTAVGNFTIVNLTLSNPSVRPVIVQLLPLVIYPDAESMLDFFRGEFPAPLLEPVEMNETLMFSLRDTELFTLRPGSPVPKLREELESVVGMQVPRFTLSMILRPGMRTRVRLGFLPSDYTLRSSLLLIRNNLTGLEPVVLYGQGAQIRMEIDNRTARGSDPLLFEIQTNHLTDCRNPRRLMHKLPTTLTVKRSFLVRNAGEVTFSVVNMTINNVPCENRGFRVLNCAPFRLEPSESTVLDIAYTPDFLMTVNEAALQLYMHMNGTPWVFDLSATVPESMLEMCHAALPRPPFEGIMYYSCVFALLFCLICVVACSYLEGDRIIVCAIRQQYMHVFKVFDLNQPATVDADFAESTGPQSTTDTRAAATRIPTIRERLRMRNQESQRDHPERNAVVRLAWHCVNYVLWLSSHLWLLVRGGDAIYEAEAANGDASSSTTIGGRRITRKNRKPLCGGGAVSGTKNRANGGGGVEETSKNQDFYNSGEAIICEEFDHGNGLWCDYDDSDRDSEKFNQPQPKSDNELKLRKKLKLMDDKDGQISRAELYDGCCPSDENKEKISQNLAPKQRVKGSGKTNNKVDAKVLAIVGVKSEKQLSNSHGDEGSGGNSRKKKSGPLDVSGRQKEEISSASSFSSSQNSSIGLQQKVPNNKVASLRPTSSANKHLLPEQQRSAGVNEFTAAKNIEKNLTLSTKKELARSKHPNLDALKKHGDDRRDGKDSDSCGVCVADDDDSRSVVPEWSTAFVGDSKNIDDDFNELALNSASLFDGTLSERERTDSSPFSSSSLSSYKPGGGGGTAKSFQKTPRRLQKTTAEDDEDGAETASTDALIGGDGIGGESPRQQRTPKRRKKNNKCQDPEIKRRIGQMTRDYRERLEQAFFSGTAMVPMSSDPFLQTRTADVSLLVPVNLAATAVGGSGASIAAADNPPIVVAAPPTVPGGGSGWPFSPPTLFPALYNNPTSNVNATTAGVHGTTTNTGDGRYTSFQLLFSQQPLQFPNSLLQQQQTQESHLFTSASAGDIQREQPANNDLSMLFNSKDDAKANTECVDPFITPTTTMTATRPNVIGSGRRGSGAASAENIDGGLFSSGASLNSMFRSMVSDGGGGFETRDDAAQTTTSSGTAHQHFGSLFNTNDPIWKPIFEDPNDLNASSSYWPADFSDWHSSEKNEAKKKEQ